MVHMKTNHYKCHDMSASLWNVKGLYSEDWQQDPMLPSDWFFRVKPNRSYEFLNENFLILENNTNARQHIVT